MATASCTRTRNGLDAPGALLITRDAVARDTPAMRATSSIVGLDLLMSHPYLPPRPGMAALRPYGRERSHGKKGEGLGR
ncbi:hypothetical protein Cs7R123_03800 [Catellatospora sp. TT07R-123]|nr:hypothetical protein Cs7R123_03800 [Catellatospora sp. TT07R-123]